MSEIRDFADLFREEEERRLAEIKPILEAEDAAERARWLALTPEEQAAETAAWEAKWDIPDPDPLEDEDEEDEDEEE